MSATTSDDALFESSSMDPMSVVVSEDDLSYYYDTGIGESVVAGSSIRTPKSESSKGNWESPLRDDISVVDEDTPERKQFETTVERFQDEVPLATPQSPRNRSHDSSPPQKPPIFSYWSRLTHRLHHWITRCVVSLSVHAARNPYLTISTIVVVSLVLVGVGFVTNFHINVDEYDIFSPRHGIPRQHFNWRRDKSGFLKHTRPTTLIVHANGNNVLGFEGMARVFTALDTVRNIPGYDDIICQGGDYYDEQTGQQTCRIISATRFWYHDTQLFHNQTQGRDDLVIATLSQTEYPPGIPADHEYVLGKLQRDDKNNEHGNGTITYVPAYFVYILLSNKEQTLEFETLVIEQLSALQQAWETEEDNVFRLEYFAERSFSDEFMRAIAEDMYLVPLIFIMMSGFTCAVFFRSDERVQSRSGLGIGAVATIGMSLMSGFGLMFISGVPYTSMTTILPFVVVGVGLDDTFIICGEYLRMDDNVDPVERIRLTMEEVGTSVTVTTLTTTTAFLLGLTSSIPAIHWLCLYAFPTILIDFIYQITFFAAILILDERRIQAKREDVCICFVRPGIQVDSINGSDNNYHEENECEPPRKIEKQKHIAERMMAWYARQLMRPMSKALVVVIFIYFFAICVYRTTLLTQEFDITDLFPQGSYAKDVLDAIEVYQERSLQVEIYFRNVNQSDPLVQQEMLQFVNELTALSPFGQEPPLCWVRDFHLLRESAYWKDLGVEPMNFEEQLLLALSNPAIREAYGMDIVHEDGVISASRCMIMMKNSYLQDVEKQISVLVSQRELTNAQPINQSLREGEESLFAFNAIFLLWGFFNVAIQELIATTVSSVIAVSIMALIFVPHWSAIFFVVPMVCIVYIDLLGTMQVAGLHINAVTYVCLVVSVGLIVDFLLHIVLRYNESTKITREGKVVETLETMGVSILLGGLSTLVGVIPLAFSTSTILRTVFTSLFFMLLLGVAHGLMFLPVVLSVIGPAADIRDHYSFDKKRVIDSPTAYSIKQDLTLESTSSSEAGNPFQLVQNEC